MNLALILARGGSKGIKGKNLKKLLGVSLTAHTVAECIGAGFDRVIVYTDAELIADEARAAGGEVFDRPEEISGDTDSSEAVVKRFLEDHPDQASFDRIALVQVTTPFLRSFDLSEGIRAMNSGKHDSAISATSFERFTGYGSGTSGYVPTRPYRALRQESKLGQWLENGGFYFATRKIWGEGKRIGYKCAVIKMGWWESLEIDEPEDLEVARALAPRFLANRTMKVSPVVGKLPRAKSKEGQLQAEQHRTRFNKR